MGGGLAGLAAALRLSESGFSVELIERRSVLGGRASSFTPPGESAPIDNCQHVLLGCCTNLLDFFSRTGALDQFRFYKRFDFLGPAGRCSLAASALPAPLHFLPSLLRFRHLSLAERWLLLRAVGVILRAPPPYPDEPLMAWLKAQRQSPAAIDHFWRVILTSALNEDPERLSTRPAFHVIVDSFVRSRRGYPMGVPKVPLSELYSERKMRQRFAVRMEASIDAASVAGDRLECLRLRNGEEIRADYFISALPPDALAGAVAGVVGEVARARWPQLEAWKALEWSPIAGIHLWFDRAVTDLPHAIVVGRSIQWIFNKSGSAQAGEPAGQYLQVVISASRALMTMRREEILDLVRRELAEIFPRSKDAKLEKAIVVKEAESTPSFPPGSDALRPGPQTPFANLFLAGDWTATGWPPTMESAVRSGYRAAECVSAAAGEPRTFLIPDLPSDFLARLLLPGRLRNRHD